ncbi:MAG: hypothetical protein ACRDRZ_12235 [Pseudonocardiaceae bacterium]
MDDPGTRQGRHAATEGSLTVADLLARRSVDERQRGSTGRTTVQLVPAPAALHRATTAPSSDEPEERSNISVPPGRAGRAVLAGGVAVALLGSLAAALQSVPVSQRPAPLAAGSQPGIVTGTDALRPDILGGELLSDRSPGTAPPAGDAPPADPGRQHDPAGAPPPAPAGHSTPGPSSTELVTDEATLRLVEELLESLPVNPDSATAVLDPALSAVDPGSFRKSWRGVQHVDVRELRREPDGRVRVAMTLVQTDGQRLRTEHLLTITNGRQPRILGAVLLSAQRL